MFLASGTPLRAFFTGCLVWGLVACGGGGAERVGRWVGWILGGGGVRLVAVCIGVGVGGGGCGGGAWVA